MADNKTKAWDNLQTVGVGYLENYGAGVDAEFPHCTHMFEISVDRDVMIARMRDDHDKIEEIAVAETRNRNLSEAFSELVDKVVQRFTEDNDG